ncbi:3-oxoacyl-[acyl-carrier-protein] synthase-1 [Dyadobacter jejuensis]|uniref:3-oxoacyl-[acyl-carrier-protein] synthase-1 n=1 Tax=Dyadobacter jejuensis TaxID=1082580 RepID=A0A316ALW5_9BACT|nr:beta-ketoacyl synthase N-terminal-like domain-containing protein [Dyadobacter jejuensis]PWJ58561.1 3-oxoacyl-[acyl-carrier-protein] synthase-1 [Dyadobacter jejuensis]
MIYIGAETMISPLGSTTEENWSALKENRSGISWVAGAGLHHQGLFLARFHPIEKDRRFTSLLYEGMQQVALKLDPSIMLSARTQVVVSATKGAVDTDIRDPFGGVFNKFKTHFGLAHQPIVVSNACISGVQAINFGDELVGAGQFDQVIVIGVDLITDFVVNGFQSLYAVSDKPCRPFDAARKGITLGEGCAAVVVGNDRSIFAEAPLELLAGSSSNDANHISGPSRTGEGLVRAVRRTLMRQGCQPEDIDLVSAHGTATLYNDEMEAIAFNRLGLQECPTLSLKGYFGHTLGCAGVLETAATMQMMRHGLMVRSEGFENLGTSKPLPILTENCKGPINTFIKTASGFGGGNAALIVRKL